ESENVTFAIFIKNQGTGKANFSLATYYIDDTFLDSVAIGQIDSGATENKTFIWVAKTGPNVFKVIVDYHERVAESDETNNEGVVELPILPDLIIESVTWSPESPSVGDTVSFTVTVKNQGNTETDSFGTHFYIDEAHKGYKVLQEVAAEETVSINFSWVAEAGSHTIRVFADSSEDVTETDESNNEETVAFSGASPPDLIIQDLTWSPLDAAAGETVTFTFTIKNQGKGIADKSYFTCYVDDIYLYADRVNAINPAATDNITFTWIVEEGPHIIKVAADSDGDVMEGDEDNNEKTVSFPLVPDLTIESITWTPEEPSESDSVTFTTVIKNQGGIKSGSFAIRFYIDETSIGHYEINEIKVEGKVTKYLSWTAEAGKHIIKVVADSTGVIDESDENNNTMEATISASPLPKTTPTATANITPVQAPTISLPAPEPKQETWPLFLVAFGVIALGVILVMFVLKSR
ncbi:CARDB domain-containing protein, partial [Chloroflexota bacterium]